MPLMAQIMGFSIITSQQCGSLTLFKFINELKISYMKEGLGTYFSNIMKKTATLNIGFCEQPNHCLTNK